LCPRENVNARGLRIESCTRTQQNLTEELLRQTLNYPIGFRREGDFQRTNSPKRAGFGDARGLVATKPDATIFPIFAIDITSVLSIARLVLRAYAGDE
jgi:hypothetical protein